jgi:Mg2+ and Co2+ transporter CorA
MYAVSSQIKKLNWRKLRDNSLLKSNWGNQRAVFEYDGFTSTISVSTISPESDSVWFKVRSKYITEEESYNASSLLSIPLSDSHYNEIIFQRQLVSALVSNLRDIESEIIEETIDEYAQFCDLRRSEIKKIERVVLEKYDDLETVILEAIEVSLYEQVNELVDGRSFVRSLYGYVLPTHYLAVSNFFEDGELYDSYISNLEDGLSDKINTTYTNYCRRLNDELEEIYDKWEVDNEDID